MASGAIHHAVPHQIWAGAITRVVRFVPATDPHMAVGLAGRSARVHYPPRPSKSKLLANAPSEGESWNAETVHQVGIGKEIVFRLAGSKTLLPVDPQSVSRTCQHTSVAYTDSSKRKRAPKIKNT